MKKVPAVLAVMALIALPILAAPKPTPTPAARVRVRSKSNITNNKEAASAVTPTPTAGPVNKSACCVKNKGSCCGVEPPPYKEGALVTPTPTAVAERNKGEGINNSKSNSYKEAAPGQSAPPTCARLVNGKIEHYPCPEGKAFETPATKHEKEGAPVTPTVTTERRGGKSIGSIGPFGREVAPGTPTPSPLPVGFTYQKIEMEKKDSRQIAPVTPTPTAGPVPNDGREKQKGTSTIGKERQPKYVAGRVLSQQGRRLTVQLSNGQTVAVDGSGLNPTPRVGSTVTVTNSRGNWVIVTR